MGLRMNLQKTVVESRNKQFEVVKKVLEEHKTALQQRKAEFNEIADHLARYEQLLNEATAFHNPNIKKDTGQQKTAHDLVVMSEAELQKIKSCSEAFAKRMKDE
ncbi:MAG: hypothetical protein V1837_00185 [Candidatus Woesearchaeota archaeon]